MRTLMRKTKQKHSEKLINTHTHTNQATRNKVKKKKSLAHTHTQSISLNPLNVVRGINFLKSFSVNGK